PGLTPGGRMSGRQHVVAIGGRTVAESRETRRNRLRSGRRQMLGPTEHGPRIRPDVDSARDAEIGEAHKYALGRKITTHLCTLECCCTNQQPAGVCCTLKKRKCRIAA